MSPDLWVFAGIGFLAQVVDGTLGMAFGIIVSSSLIAFGVPPAFASAGMLGGALGAYALVDLLPKWVVRPLVTIYLLAMAALIFERILRRQPPATKTSAAAAVTS